MRHPAESSGDQLHSPPPTPPVHVLLLPISPPLELDYIGLSAAAAGGRADDDLKGTELRLELPGCESPNRRPAATSTTLELLPAKGTKRGFSDEAVPPAPPAANGKGKEKSGDDKDKKVAAPPQPAAKAQVVGWPPIRSYRKNTMATTTNQLKSSKEDSDAKQGQEFLYVKVSMDVAPYLRKVDLKTYKNYKDLFLGLEKMFSGFSAGKLGRNFSGETKACLKGKRETMPEGQTSSAHAAR